MNQQGDVVLISDDKTDVEKVLKEVGSNNCDNPINYLLKGSNDVPEPSLDECKFYLRKNGIRISGTNEECMQRMIDHLRLIDGGGVSLYPRSSFSINCTGDACKGDVVMFKQIVCNSLRKVVGRRTVAGRIVGECYGDTSQQHIYSVEVLWSKPIKKLSPLSILVLKGPSLYKFGTFRQPWTSESERSEVLREKHVRGNAARHKRKLRQTSSNNKGKKRQKVSHRGQFQSKHPAQIDKHNPKRKDADSVEESTLTHKRKAVTVRFQKTKMKRLKDGKAKSLYPRSSFSINCTGDACKGDVVLFKQKQFIKRGERVGRILTLAGRIVKESYGALSQQHTFMIEVLWTKHSMNPSPVSTIFVRGCNLYRFGTFRQPWKNEAERLEVLKEKHNRGKAARHQRRLRLAHIASTNEKESGEKHQKSSRNKQTTRTVKWKLSKRQGATIAKPPKRKSTQPTPQPNLNPSVSKQPTRIDKKKFSKKPGSTLVKESKSAPNSEAVQFQRMDFNRSTQPTFHPNSNPNSNPNPNQNPNPNPNQNPNPNYQFQRMDFNRSTQPTFHQDPNPNPNYSMYFDHNLQEASSSFPYGPNHPNRFMFSDHHLQDPSSSLPYVPTFNLCSPGYGQYNNQQWGPNNVFHQPAGQYHYNYGQPDYYHPNFEQTRSQILVWSTVLSCMILHSLGVL